MLGHIQTGDFFFGTDPQAHGLFDDEEHCGDDDCHIRRNTHYTKGLNTQEVEAAAIEDTLFGGNTGGEETGKDGTQSTANTVNGYGTDRIIDLNYLIEELNSKNNHNTENGTHDSSTQRRNSITASGNANQACQGSIVGHGNIRLAVANPGEDQGHTAGYRSGQIGVEENQTGAGNRFVGIHGHGGSTVEAEPAEPQNENPKGSSGQIMAQNRLGLSILVVLANPGSKHPGTDTGAHAANHMDCGGTGKIMEAQLAQPAAAPDPVAGNRINKQGNGGGVDAVGAELGALCHRAGNNGGRGGAEHRLEDCECPQRNAAGECVAVIPHNAGVQPADDGVSRTEHDAEAKQPEAGCADAEVHQVFHQNVAGVLCTSESGFAQGETCLHKENQSGT